MNKGDEGETQEVLQTRPGAVRDYGKEQAFALPAEEKGMKERRDRGRNQEDRIMWQRWWGVWAL